MATAAKASTNIPFRIRVGLIGQLTDAEREAIEEGLKTVMLNLFDEVSRRFLQQANHTALAFSYVNLTDDTRNSVDLLLITHDQSIDINSVAQGLRPVVTVSKTKPPRFTVAR